MTELSTFIHRKEFNQIQQDLINSGLEKSACSFNSFSLSSYNTHFENFHSDIIKAILDPQGDHGEGNLFLELFVEFLNGHFDLKLNIADYIDSQVERENGRIDIGIRNRNSGKVIIIENKINNAPDMDDQLLRYYNHCVDDNLEVELIIYLSMDGLKMAPLFDGIKCSHINLAAYNNSNNDLAMGWVKECVEKSLKPNSQSLLNEYYKLLQYLNGQAMENNAAEIFYHIINEDKGLVTIENIIKFYTELPKFRMDKFVARVDKNYQPFTNQYRYRPAYQLYQNYVEGTNKFKIDVWFEQGGKANVVFWDGEKENWNAETRVIVKQKLQSIDMFDGFEEIHYGLKGYSKSFTLSEYQTMSRIDDAVYEFVMKLFQLLKETNLVNY